MGTSLLSAFRAQGVELKLEEGRLLYRAPRGVRSPELLTRLSRHKPEMLALLRAETPDEANETPYELVTEQRDLRAVLQALDESDRVGLDLETTGLDPRADRLRLLALATGRGTWLVDGFAVDPRPLFELLAGRVLLIHNAAFDLAFLWQLGFRPGPVRCTLTLSRLLYGSRRPRGYHALEACVARELGRTLDKQLQAADWSGTLTRRHLDYAAADAAVLPALDDALACKIRAAGLTAVADIEGLAVPAVAWLAASGFPLDADAWRRLAQGAGAEAQALALRLDAALPPPAGLFGAWNWDSPRQAVAAFAAAGVPLADSSDAALAGADLPAAGLLRSYRGLRKRATVYGLDWLQHVAEDGRVYPARNQTGADSGRMSCAKPNAQQLPRDGRYRRCVRAPEGRVLVKADYSQIELRIAAKVSGDAAMLDAYRRGLDLHALTARQVLGLRDVTREHRQLAKALNFGLVYGMGAEGFRAYAKSNYGVDLTAEQAARYREAFFNAYPGLRRWHRATPQRPVDTRTLAGRRRCGVQRYTEKLNTPVQGTGADGLKRALALLWERRADVPGAFPVLAVHDEIVVECAKGQAEAAAAWLRRAMLDGFGDWLDPVPVEVEVRVATSWGGE